MNKDEKNGLCYKCDSLRGKEEVVYLHLSNRGYGSLFDSCAFVVQMCRECLQPEHLVWFNEQPHIIQRIENYQFENDIRILINSFKVENAEYVWNGMNGYYMDRQDWIACEKGTLSDDRYEELGLYSPRQIRSYKESFSSCDLPVNIFFSDGSKNCMCPLGATGEYGQRPSFSISTECHLCPYFLERRTPLEDMTHESFIEYQSFFVGKLRYETFQNKFEK